MKIWSLYNVENGLYRVFTTAKRAFSFRKRGRLFKKYFFRSLNGAFKPRKKGTFLLLKNLGGGGGTCPHCPPPPGSAAPVDITYTSESEGRVLFQVLSLKNSLVHEFIQISRETMLLLINNLHMGGGDKNLPMPARPTSSGVICGDTLRIKISILSIITI